jgi:putative inorganic carbon (HCO3(-)) transporter
MQKLKSLTLISLFNRLLQHSAAGVALILFTASAFVGMWATYDPSLSWPILLTLLVSISLFFAVASFAISPRWVVWGLVVMAGLLALYFVTQYAHLNYEHEVGPLARLGRMTGSLTPNLVFFTPHPNAVAGFLEGAFLLSLLLTVRVQGSSRWLWAAVTTVIAYGLLISGSRGAWLGLAIAIGIWALLSFRNQALQLAMTGFGFMVGILGGAYAVICLASPGQHIPILSSAFETGRTRLILYQNSLQLLKDYPFTGIGLGDTFAMVYSRYQLLIHVPFLYYAHNLFLAVGLGQGLLGLLALIWLLFAFYRFVIRVERTNSLDTRLLPLFRAGWLGTTVTLVHGLLDSPQFSQDFWTMPVLFALAGLAVAMGRLVLDQTDQEEVGKTSPAQPRYGKWIIIALAAIAVGLLVTLLIFWRPLASAWYANVGAVYQTKADSLLSPDLDDTVREAETRRAAAYFERALDLNPAQLVAHRRLGMMALDQQNFETAVSYLEQAYSQEPQNQATLKLLGYAYVWTGQLNLAEERFRQLNPPGTLVDELEYWQWWWGTQDREDLSTYAGEMAGRLSME